MSSDVFMAGSLLGPFQALAYQNCFSLAVGSASVTSNTFTGAVVTLSADTDCYVTFNGNPAVVGATGSFFLAKGVIFSVAFPAGSGRISVIQASAAGHLTYAVAAQG
jgi:hypothetical protein